MTKSSTRLVDEPSAAAIRSHPREISPARLIWAAPLALALAAIAIYGGLHFPVASLPIVISLVLYAALLWREPRLWLFFVPALLPILNLAPWSGRFFFDEFDLFLLMTVAIWLLRSGSRRPARFAPAAATLVFLFVLAFCASLAIGLFPLDPIDGNAFASYFSKYNGLRVGKGLLWSLILIFLARSDLARDADALNRYWVPGMLAGLAGVVAVALWERVAFPGLTNFAEDYRITATFGAMHVGGAAIDGYLALAIPFTLAWMAGSRSLVKIAMAGTLFVLGTYVIIATFSRGLYMAYLVMIVMFALGTMIRQMATGVFSAHRGILVVVTVFALSFLCFSVFAAGGYRTLAAVLGVMGLAFFLGSKPDKPSSIAPALSGIILLVAINFILIKVFDKGAYVAYALSFLIALAGTAISVTRPRASKQRLAWCGLIATAMAAIFVGNHWGGAPALIAASTTVMFILALLALNRSLKRPLWRPNLKHAVPLTFVASIFFASIPIAGNSYFVGERFSDRSSALRARLAHWRDTLGMMDGTSLAKTFGMGVGRFPGLFFWRSQLQSPSGTFQMVNEMGNSFLKLGGHLEGFSTSPTLFYAQRIDATPYQVLNLSFDARTTSPNSRLQVGICESLLLYSQNCETKWVAITKADGTWNGMEVSLNTRDLGAWHYFGKRPVQIWFVNPIGGTHVDIDNARLTDQFGSNLLHNGDFSQGGDRWLFSVSDFGPWHIENIWVHFLFEQGWVGLILFSALILYGFCRLFVLASRGQFLALVMLVSFAGFVTVGTLNSLFEFPRIALLFYLLLFFSLLRWKVEDRGSSHARTVESVRPRSESRLNRASPDGTSSVPDRLSISKSHVQ